MSFACLPVDAICKTVMSSMVVKATEVGVVALVVPPGTFVCYSAVVRVCIVAFGQKWHGFVFDQ